MTFVRLSETEDCAPYQALIDEARRKAKDELSYAADLLSKATAPGAVTGNVSSGSVGYGSVSSSPATANGNSWPFATNAPSGTTITYTIEEAVAYSESPVLPLITMESIDITTDDKIMVIVKPEYSNITAAETMRITQLMTVYMLDPSNFNVLEYIRKNNLERHFSYEPA